MTSLSRAPASYRAQLAKCVLREHQVISKEFTVVVSCNLCKNSKNILGGKPADITILPDLVLENIFERVVESDGDRAILNLSLVCRRWKDIVANDTFRRNVHFQWLSNKGVARGGGSWGARDPPFCKPF